MEAPTLPLPERLGIDPSLFDLWGQLDADTQAAAALVFVCYCGHGFNLAKERRLAMRWWSEFLPERVVLAAKTSATVQEFTAELVRRLKGQIGTRFDSGAGEAQRQVWAELIALPVEQQRRVLDILENQAMVCVTLIRANSDARRKQYGEATEGSSNNRGAGDDGAGRPADASVPGLFDGPGDVPDSAAGPADAQPAL